MEWTLVLVGFSLAVLMGSALLSLFATIRPEWSARRRRLTAAAVLPAITLIATLLGAAFVVSANHGQSAQLVALAIRGLVMIGGGFILLAWIGGLIGATLASRRRGG
jgi:hypothetical protein